MRSLIAYVYKTLRNFSLQKDGKNYKNRKKKRMFFRFFRSELAGFLASYGIAVTYVDCEINVRLCVEILRKQWQRDCDSE